MKRPNRHSSPWLTRWTLVLFGVASAVAASCGSSGGSDGPSNARGGKSSGGESTGGSNSGGTSGGGSGGAGESAGQGGSSVAEGGAPSAGTTGTGGKDGVPDAGKMYPDISFIYDAGSSDAPLTTDAACAATAVETLPIPLDMYVVLDRSGSMNLPQSLPVGNTTPGGGDCNVGDATVSRWCYSINALDRFFGSPAAEGTNMALQFFPAGGCTNSPSPLLYGCCNDGACCNGAAEAKPELKGLLPDARPAFAAALNAATPWADRTPLEAALRGIVNYTAAAARPGRQMLGLLITDGGPEGCQNNAASLASLVLTHRLATRIPIYVVGTQGAAYPWLEAIAEAGGAPLHDTHCAGGVKPCHFYDVANAKPDVFIEVLQQIQRAAIACSYAMPTSDAGLVDPNEVAVSFSPSAGGAPARVPHVAKASACGNAAGFFYDDNSAPSVISLCPSSCDALRAGDGGKVELLLGCKGS